MSTYALRRPAATHQREVPCSAADCAAYLNGWTTAVDPNQPLGQDRLEYIRNGSGRRFVEHVRGDGVIEFTFAAGQTCFGTHVETVDRDPLYLRFTGARDAYGRGQLIDPYQHDKPEHWVEDVLESQDKLRKLTG